MIVLDASAVVEYLLGRPAGVLVDVALSSEPTSAPHLLDVEVAAVVRRFELRGELEATSATGCIQDLKGLPIRRYPHGPLITRACTWRHNVTVYDGVYLALAEALDATLITLDASLAAVPGCTARVDVLASN